MSAKTVVVALVLLSGVLIAGSYLVIGGQNQPETEIVSYRAQDRNRPIVAVKNSFVNLGRIKVSEQKETDFTIENDGNRPLQVFHLSSSCHCTFGQLVYQGKTSQEYGMADVSDVLATIAPHTQALVRVIYRPYIMPAYGPVEREVYLSTNDPTQPRLVFQVSATVQ